MSSTLLNSKDISRAVSRISHEILERNHGAGNIALVGIRTRGVVLSQRLREKIKEIEGVTVDHGVLDITLYRDDLADGIHKPELKNTEIEFSL